MMHLLKLTIQTKNIHENYLMNIMYILFWKKKYFKSFNTFCKILNNMMYKK